MRHDASTSIVSEHEKFATPIALARPLSTRDSMAPHVSMTGTGTISITPSSVHHSGG